MAPITSETSASSSFSSSISLSSLMATSVSSVSPSVAVDPKPKVGRGRSDTIVRPGHNLARYDVRAPVNGNGPVPRIPADYIAPKHVRAAPFDPHEVDTRKGIYRGSVGLRNSKDRADQAVIEILDWDGVRMGTKIWNRENEYRMTGLVRIGPMRDSKLYTFNDALLYYVSHIPGGRFKSAPVVAQAEIKDAAPTLIHTDSNDSVSTVATDPLLTPATEVDAMSFDSGDKVPK